MSDTLHTLRIKGKRVILESPIDNRIKLHIKLPINKQELADIVNAMHYYDSYGLVTDEIIAYYQANGKVHVDVFEENRAVLDMHLTEPPYLYGCNKNVKIVNATDMFKGGFKRRGKSPKPYTLDMIKRGLILNSESKNETIINHYADIIKAVWDLCYEYRIEFEYNEGYARELFRIGTRAYNNDTSGILARAEDDDDLLAVLQESGQFNADNAPKVELLYGNLDDGYDTPVRNTYFTKDEILTRIKQNSFDVKLNQILSKNAKLAGIL